MIKAKNQDIVDVIDYFTNKYEIERNQVEPLVFKAILNAPLYTSNMQSRFVVTDKDEHPLSIALIRSNILLLAKYNNNGDSIIQFGGLRNRVHQGQLEKTKLIFREDELKTIQTLNENLPNITDFKSLVNFTMENVSEEKLEFFSKFTDNVLFSLVNDIKAGRETDVPSAMIQNNIANKLKNLTYLWQIESIYLEANFKDFNEFEKELYKRIEPMFELFYFEQEIKLGTLSLSKTEEELMRIPLVNDIEDYLHLNFPEYFISRDSGINEYTIDDVDIKFGGKSFTQEDIHHTVVYNNDLPSIKYFEGTEFVSVDESSKDINSIRFIGENTFYTDYYLFLKHTKTEGGLNHYEITNPMFNGVLNPDIIKNVLDKCLDTANKNKAILNINEYERNIEGFDFGYANYLKDKVSNYPDVILINTKIYDTINYELVKINNHTEAKQKHHDYKRNKLQKNNSI